MNAEAEVFVPEWGTTDRVFYCRVHDSLIRRMEPEAGFQCDRAHELHIPIFVEECTREVARLVADA